jgi:hypothetical protein
MEAKMNIASNEDSEKNKGQSHSYWKMHIQNWESGKLSQEAYCHQVGIKLTTFIYWRSKLSHANASKKAFIPVRLTEASAPKPPVVRSGIQIKLASNITISMPSDCSTDAIVSLIRKLEVSNA